MINIDFEAPRFLPEEKETFLIGEQINDLLTAFFKKGVDDGVFRADVELMIYWRCRKLTWMRSVGRQIPARS